MPPPGAALRSVNEMSSLACCPPNSLARYNANFGSRSQIDEYPTQGVIIIRSKARLDLIVIDTLSECIGPGLTRTLEWVSFQRVDCSYAGLYSMVLHLFV